MKLNDLVNKLIATNANGRGIVNINLILKIIKEDDTEKVNLWIYSLNDYKKLHKENKELFETEVVMILDISIVNYTFDTAAQLKIEVLVK